MDPTHISVLGLVLTVVLFGTSMLVKQRGKNDDQTDRRLDAVEKDRAALNEKVAKLEERSTGFREDVQDLRTEVKYVKDKMVGREEWETRHNATDAILQRILDELMDRRKSGAALEEPPPPARQRTGRNGLRPSGALRLRPDQPQERDRVAVRSCLVGVSCVVFGEDGDRVGQFALRQQVSVWWASIRRSIVRHGRPLSRRRRDFVAGDRGRWTRGGHGEEKETPR